MAEPTISTEAYQISLRTAAPPLECENVLARCKGNATAAEALVMLGRVAAVDPVAVLGVLQKGGVLTNEPPLAPFSLDVRA